MSENLVLAAQVEELRLKLSQKGWTPGKKDIVTLAECWERLDAGQKESALIALARLDHSACQKLSHSWPELSDSLKGAWARSLGRSIFKNQHVDALLWLREQLTQSSDVRTRKGFIQATGAALQSENLTEKLAFIEALIAAAKRNDLEPSESKALADALSKSADPRALDLIQILLSKSGKTSGGKEALILERDLARGQETDAVQVTTESLSNSAPVVVWFIPGVDQIAKKQLLFAGSQSLRSGVLFLEEGINLAGLKENRLWKDIGIVLGVVAASEDISKVVTTSHEKLRGPLCGLNVTLPVRVRYGRSGRDGRGDVWKFADDLSRAKAGVISDGRKPHWDIQLEVCGAKTLVIAVPQSLVDERWKWRQATVEGASQSTLAAALVHFAGVKGSASVWDPFCGAGTELMEAHIQSKGAAKLTGTDLDAHALKLAEDAATSLGAVAKFLHVDALAVDERFDVIVTNPPFGMRTSRGEARDLLQRFFVNVRSRLNPGGRFVLLSHAPASTAAWARTYGLKIVETIPVMLGRMECEFQKFEL